MHGVRKVFFSLKKDWAYDTRVLQERIKKGAGIPLHFFLCISALEKERKKFGQVFSGFIRTQVQKNRRNAHTHKGRMGAKKWWRNTLKIYIFSMMIPSKRRLENTLNIYKPHHFLELVFDILNISHTLCHCVAISKVHLIFFIKVKRRFYSRRYSDYDKYIKKTRFIVCYSVLFLFSRKCVFSNARWKKDSPFFSSWRFLSPRSTHHYDRRSYNKKSYESLSYILDKKIKKMREFRVY